MGANQTTKIEKLAIPIDSAKAMAVAKRIDYHW